MLRWLSAYRYCIAACLMFLVFVVNGFSQERQVFFREDFKNLEKWRPLNFPKISAHTKYSIEAKDGERFLKAESNASASALIYKEEFNVYEYPKARWRWRVDSIYLTGDQEKKSGDDYPIRIYVVFKYDPDQAGGLEKVKYGLAKKIYGEYPPHSTLNYIWASRDDQKTIITSPYTERAKLITLEKGGKKTGTWQDEEISIVEDYRKAFGSDPPPIASLGIMNDSDNTGEKSISYVDFIEVFKNGK